MFENLIQCKSLNDQYNDEIPSVVGELSRKIVHFIANLWGFDHS